MLDLATSTPSSRRPVVTPRLDPLVVVVDRDRQRLLGRLLPDDVGVEELEDLPRLGQVPELRSASPRSSSSMISLQRSMHSSQM
jgi:hypothetical protein